MKPHDLATWSRVQALAAAACAAAGPPPGPPAAADQSALDLARLVALGWPEHKARRLVAVLDRLSAVSSAGPRIGTTFALRSTPQSAGRR